jgi:hypothetical protein
MKRDLMRPEPEIEHFKEWMLVKFDLLTDVCDPKTQRLLFRIPTLDLERSPHLLISFWEAFTVGHDIGVDAGAKHTANQIKEALQL